MGIEYGFHALQQELAMTSVSTLEATKDRVEGQRAVHQQSRPEPLPGEDKTREDRIRERAYALWLEEGQPEGRHEHHWALAAQEMEEQSGRQEMARAA